MPHYITGPPLRNLHNIIFIAIAGMLFWSVVVVPPLDLLRFLPQWKPNHSTGVAAVRVAQRAPVLHDYICCVQTSFLAKHVAKETKKLHDGFDLVFCSPQTHNVCLVLSYL